MASRSNSDLPTWAVDQAMSLADFILTLLLISRSLAVEEESTFSLPSVMTTSRDWVCVTGAAMERAISLTLVPRGEIEVDDRQYDEKEE